MPTTPKPVIAAAVRSACRREVVRLVRITSGGLHETYRTEVADGPSVVVRIARRGEPWFADEEYMMSQAREVGVPTPTVLGVEHIQHEGELLSVSVLSFVDGQSLAELAGELTGAELERLLMECGELLARLHSVTPDKGMTHELAPPTDELIIRATRTAHEIGGHKAAVVVERGANLLHQQLTTRAAPNARLAHGDWLPKHFLIEADAIAGVIDWEFAGRASPAFDLARWEVSAGGVFHDRIDVLHRGYAQVADPDEAAGGWVPAFAIDWALEVLGWTNPASAARRRRCVEVIARYA